MSETHKNEKAAPKVEAATAFTTWQNLWRGEAQRFLDESGQAMERYFGEAERAMHEGSRLFAAQTRAMHEMSRAVLAGTKTMLG
ncbi:MAG: hypothetical protein IT383_05250 [Deltaproteobacteria bacterium]|nr:hypothetical protein [Deltaproteobacteria bacterium]